MSEVTVLRNRAAGILLAVSSLPSHHGIGTFGDAALRWLDFLSAAGQQCWQILPLGPTGWGDSPYQSFSAFALNPYYIDLDRLVEAKLLTLADLADIPWGDHDTQVNYAALYHHRESVLRRAFARFRPDAAFDAFCRENAFWLEDYCLFMALKQTQGGVSHLMWEAPLHLRDESVLAKRQHELATDTAYHRFAQYTAWAQWQEVRAYAAKRGIAIIGDMPMYVSMDSADVWAAPRFFQVDSALQPERVAGCPPDAFAVKGQLWGNPLYRWEVLAQDGFGWWLSRLRTSLALYDAVRIDHFRAFESYFSIPAGASDASGGTWVGGPSTAFIDAIHAALPGARIIAEDLGYLTPEVRALLDASGFPGMKVLQFAFDSREPSDYMPHTYSRNCVVYTGTHDNTTSLHWFASAPADDVTLACDYFGISREHADQDGHWAFIRTALASVAHLAVIPAQDYLGLGVEARMNTPSTTGANWQWRLKSDALTPTLAARIRRLTEITGRTGARSA